MKDRASNSSPVLPDAETVVVQNEEPDDAVFLAKTAPADTLVQGRGATDRAALAVTAPAEIEVAHSDAANLTRPSPYAATMMAADNAGGRRPARALLTAEHPGRYQVGDVLGSGGHGEVVAVYDRHLERSVALKKLHRKGKGTLEMSPLELRFVNEARITGMLEHPGIVPVYELGRREDGSVYYVMRLVRGDSLQTALENAETLQERLLLLPRFVDACHAMAYAHSRGVVHRDLKPDNIMLGSFEETLVVDWGLAKVQGEDDVQCEVLASELAKLKDSTEVKTVHGSVVGTPAYMPPEQCLGLLEEIDERSDVYALGAVLYHLICGRPPFIGGTLLHIIKRTVEEDLVPPIEREFECPPELDAIAQRALAKDPAARYPDARALADDVRAFLDGGIVGAHRYTTAQRFRRWLGRHRVAAALVLAGVVTAGGVYVVQDRRARRALAAQQTKVERDRVLEEEARNAKALESVNALLRDAEKGATAPRWLDTYAFRIINLADPVVHATVENRLVAALAHPVPAVRKLAARSLGGMRGGLALDALSARLAEDGEQNLDVQVEIINALGVIGDSKAELAVRKARWRGGQYGKLWEQTKLAYRMIPMPPVPEGTELTPDEWTDRGRSLSNKSDREGAVAAYDKALSLDPKLGRALNNRAIELTRMERFEDALRDYNRSIELDPDEPKGIYNRAVLKRKMEDYEGAVADYSKLIEAGKLQQMSLRSRAYALRWLGRPDEAIADYESALEQKPDNSRTHYGLGQTYLEMGRLRDAIAAYDRALAVNEDMTSALIGRAEAQRAGGHQLAARRDLDKAVELDPASQSIRVHRASVFLALGKRKEAMADLNHCIENTCDGAEVAYKHAARAILGYLAAGDHVRALAEMELAFAAAEKRSSIIEAALWGLAIATAVDSEGDREKWTQRLEPKGNRWHDRVARVVHGKLDHPDVIANVPLDRKCLALLAVGVREQLGGRTTEAQKWFTDATAVPRPANLSCVLAAELEGFEGR